MFDIYVIRMTRKIALKLKDGDFNTLSCYLKKYQEDISIEEYLTKIITLFLKNRSFNSVYCPHGCEESEIRPIRIISTLFNWHPKDPDPNIYTTEYMCEKCDRIFWVRRRLGMKEEYFEENLKPH